MEQLTPLERAFEHCGSQAALAQKIGVTAQAITKWKRQIPARRVLDIERATGGVVTRYDLRPDIYPREEPLAGSSSNHQTKAA